MRPAETAAAEVPRGVAVRYPAGATDRLWHDAAELPDGRLALAVGHCAHHDPAATRREVGSALRSPDPVRALLDWRRAGATALVALLDPTRSGLSFAGLGEPSLAVSRPDAGHRILAVTAGRSRTAALPPGSTLVLGSAPAPWGGTLDECASLRPGDAADLLASGPSASPDLVTLLYRSAPAPLSLNLPARPESLALLRDRLGRWLALAGLDPQSSADVVLAVGEAASNAAEHAGSPGGAAVALGVDARVRGGLVELTITDDGRWKPVGPPASHRGHGLNLIEALVDGVRLTSSEGGTTLEMTKALRP